MKRLISYLVALTTVFSLNNAYASNNETCEVRTFHSNGNKALEVCLEDRDNDSYYETEIIRRFTSSGKLRRIEYDYNKDGSPDRTFEWRFKVVDGQEVRYVMYEDRNGDEIADSVMRWYFSYDARILRRITDYNNDGIQDQVLDFFYDDKGNVTTKPNDSDLIAKN